MIEKGDLVECLWWSDHSQGGLTARHIEPGGQTGCLGWSDRLLLTQQLEMLCFDIIDPR
jgi:hypothetical protein